MTVNKKIIFIFCVLFLFFSSGLFLYLWMNNSQLRVIRKSQIQERQAIFEKILKLNRQAIFVLANDYSYWDELANAIKNEDVQWGKTNIDSGIQTYQADAAWIYNMDFKRIYSVNRFSDTRLSDLPLSKEQIEHIFAGQTLVHFFMDSPAGYLEIQGATVHPSNDSERKTKPQGYFLVAKLWNADFLTLLSQLISSKISVISAQDAVKLFCSRDAFFIPVVDWAHSPLFTIKGVVDSSVLKHFENRAKVLISFFLSYTAMQMLYLLYFLRRFFKKS